MCLICILEDSKAISVTRSALTVCRCYRFALLSAQEAISLTHLHCLLVRCLPPVLALCSASGAESTVRKCKAVWSRHIFHTFFFFLPFEDVSHIRVKRIFASLFPSVHVSLFISTAPTGWISFKFDAGNFCENLLGNPNLGTVGQKYKTLFTKN